MEQMMKACQLHRVGDFHCDEVPVPVPHGEELLIRVGAADPGGRIRDLRFGPAPRV